MRLKEPDKSVTGAHHLTRENISYEISYLRQIEAGKEDISNIDWRTEAGILASELEWLLSHFDS